MINRILINREECEVRVAFMEEQTLVELHTEKFDEQTIVNNIYRGRIQDVVPGLQAAFVDVGLERNLFLHFMDIRAESLVLGHGDDALDSIREAAEKGIPGRVERKGRRPKPNQNGGDPPIRKGDEIIVQVVKDEIGGKAPRVTTNLALAGRYLVMLPFPSQEGGVSRKIVTGADRIRLKKLLAHLKSDDHSFIVRTAGVDQPEEPVRKDGEALMQLWKDIIKRYRDLGKPGLIHNDHDLIARLVRDAFPSDFEEVICDNEIDGQTVERELRMHMPHSTGAVKVYKGTENILDAFGAEKQIDKAMADKIWLKSGGYLIVDENEALTAIDINTGRFTGKKDQEKTSLKTNLEACEAIAQMIRLRDIGGIIVIDFIDMLSRSHQEQVAEELRRQLRKDRAKLAIGKIGDFGLMMLTRKRQRISLHKQIHDECPYCHGRGYVLKPDEVYRRLKYDVMKALSGDDSIRAMMISAHPWTVDLLRNRYRNFIRKLKDQGCEVALREDAHFHIEDYQITPMRRKIEQPLLLTGDRIDPDERIRAVDDLPVDFKSQLEDLPEEAIEELPTEGGYEDSDEEIREAAEMQAAPEPVAQAPSESSGRRRRLRKRHGESAGTPEPEVEPASAESAAESEPAEEIETKQATDSDEEDGSRKTRRGRRAGRRRGRETSEEPVEQPKEDASSTPSATESPKAEPAKEEEPKEAQAAPSPPPVKKAEPVAEQQPAAPPKPKEPLKLAIKKSGKDALLADLLGDLDQELETLRGTEKPPPSEAPASEPQADPQPAEEAAVTEPAAPEETPAEEPKKTGRSRKTPKKTATAKAATAKKTSTSRAKKKAENEPDATADEKSKKTAPKKRTTSTRAKKTTKAAEGEGETPKKTGRAKKSASTGTRKRATTKKTQDGDNDQSSETKE